MIARKKTPREVAAEYAPLPYAVEVEGDNCAGQPCYLARHPELPGCMVQGATPEEAVASLAEARLDLLTVQVERGDSIPVPRAASSDVRIAR